jgi:aspartyl-tRNA(Asn)/glutamyl-tRNA(Gln) amidotransferase subunit B
MRIGLEVHVALPTKSKLFCSCSTEGETPNSAICPICMGFPGSKPVLNKGALEVAVNVANALECRVNQKISFIRKVYFYPDLPKSFQISQLDGSVGFSGRVRISASGINKYIGITRIQLEEDPAKVVRGDDYCLLDFNRSGIPLVEIVTEPDIASEEELYAFMNELRDILYYLGIDVDKEMKADLNISTYGDKVEIKNVLGIKNLIDAQRFELKRQEELNASGQKIRLETRSYDETKMETRSSREKESNEEYGFVFEPDLSFYSTEWVKREKPIIPSAIAKDYATSYSYEEKPIYEAIKSDRDAFRLIEAAKDECNMRFIINVIGILKRNSKLDISTEVFKKLVSISDSGMTVTEKMIADAEAGLEIRKSRISEEDIKRMIVEEIGDMEKFSEEIKDNPKRINSIIGRVSKKSGANPKDIMEIALKMLGKQ